MHPHVGPDLAPPLVTVCLVTHQGLRWLPGCLGTLRAQDLERWELLVLDNASTDGTAAWLARLAAEEPRMSLSRSNRNLGYAAAHNRLIALARGEAVLLLNQDVELDPGFLRAAVASLRMESRAGAVQGRIRRLAGPGERLSVLDTTGLVAGRDRRFVSRGQAEADGPTWQQPGEVFGADGPAPVYRRTALLDARLPASRGGWEVLDEDFFMYKEDVDLAWRLRCLGWRTRYAPDALAWHARTGGGAGARSAIGIVRSNRTNPRWINRLSWRNQRLMQVKNESLGSFVRDLPWILWREVLSLGYVTVLDPARLAAVPGLLGCMPAALRKRRVLQRRLRDRPPHRPNVWSQQ